LVAEDTVEQKVVERAQQKLKLDTWSTTRPIERKRQAVEPRAEE